MENYEVLLEILVRDAIGPGATRDTVEEVTAYLDELLSMTVTPEEENQAPVLEPVGDLEVMPGGRLEVQLQATDPDGDGIIFSLGNSEDLPAGMLEGNGTLVFTYTDGRVTAIADPAGRVTELEYDAAGNLTRITDPDGTQRTWEYDANNHMTAEIDKRGNREETTYDFAGRADAAVLKDGSELDFDPVQVQGLYEPDETIDPLDAPVAFQLGAVESSYVDANGNTIAYTLDQAGQIVSAMDEVVYRIPALKEVRIKKLNLLLNGPFA